MTDLRRVRLRTAQDKRKAFGQYDELRRTGRVARSVVIAELHDGSVQILGSCMTPNEMAAALVIAAEALAKADDKLQEVRLEPHVEPEERGERSGDRPLPGRVKDAPDGTLEPPLGEGWISCGECHHPRFYVTHDDLGEAVRRLVCAHCRNEILLVAEDRP